MNIKNNYQNVINKSKSGLGDTIDDKGQFKKPDSDIDFKTGEISNKLPKNVKIFLEIKRQANNINSVKKFLNADSKDIKNITQYKDLLRVIEDIESTNIVDLSNINNPIDGTENHFLNSFISNREFHYKLLANLYLTETNNELNTMLNDYSNAMSSYIFNENKRIKASERLLQNLIDGLIQISLYKNSKNIFSEGVNRQGIQSVFEYIFRDETSVAYQIKNIQENPDHPLHGNLFISELLPMLNQGEITYFSDAKKELVTFKTNNLSFRNKPNDTTTKNMIIQAAKEIYEKDEMLFKSLILLDLFQTGNSFSKLKINDLMPYQFVMQFTNNIENLNLNYQELNNLFQRILLVNANTMLPKFYVHKKLSPEVKAYIPFSRQYIKNSKTGEYDLRVIIPAEQGVRNTSVTVNHKIGSSIFGKILISAITDTKGQLLTNVEIVGTEEYRPTDRITIESLKDITISENNEIELLKEFSEDPTIIVEGLSSLGQDIFNNFEQHFGDQFGSNPSDELKIFIAKAVEDGNLDLKCGL